MVDSATHHRKQHLLNFQIFCIVPVTDSATQRLPRGGFWHAASKIAAGASKQRGYSQAKRTTAKLEYLKFTNENKF
jgi:hypothetical protein